ncbi:hypothetical protein CHU92_09045 [Flavobacterium cyanobacteriorum]|uniref:Ig-like domain-containing protein n=1 Tax=Flavobacterium cyanobacteriorum TaxID=2022802 RepID=A0A255Z5S9_9FLAO|nr:T9SS type B sorting domain-containing protein [Flavobacterium cyanobacteriorum]OYQ36887.1 hypothetical protein CHU92_09045 [Flavobacterium cyanobacteriorum]
MKGIKLLLILLCCTSISYTQPADFSITVVKTDETCIGNGTVTVTAQNTTPLATLQYIIYKYPNLTTPVSANSTGQFINLTSGNYKIRVIQTLQGNSNTREQDIVILNIDNPLEYSFTVSNLGCAQGVQLTITVTQGTGVGYEIISGPVTRPLQTSNIFTNLPAGTYNFRVFNECGVGVVTTYQLVLNEAVLSISDPSFSQTSSGDCNFINVVNTVAVSGGAGISYPLFIQYTINLPGGVPPLIINRNIPSGPASGLELSQMFQIFPNTPYTYSISITDGCNTVVESSGTIDNSSISIGFEPIPVPCGKKYLSLLLSGHTAPVTVTFMSAPPDFNPAEFNTQHPGPFNTSQIDYGRANLPIPEGTYNIQITDACGRTDSVVVTIEYNNPIPEISGQNNGCFSVLGRITASVPDRSVVTAVVLSAPDNYAPAPPHDVSGFITSGRLVLNNVPVGLYTIQLIDNCGAIYEVPVEVPLFVERGFTSRTKADCTPGNGSVRIRSLNGNLTDIDIIQAPAAFGTFPVDVSVNINTTTGIFYMSGLPEGEYRFSGTDVCGIQRSVDITVTGYQPDAEPYDFVPNCGSFFITMDDDAAPDNATYWLQKKNPVTGEWSHPETGVVYTEGTVPDATTGMALINFQTVFNLTFDGKFRILKSFESYNNGSEIKKCIIILGEFNYSMDLQIVNAYTLSCDNRPNDIYIEAENGLQPYVYRIKKKNGATFIVENGNNNIFQQLESAIYEFEVEDACGNREPSIIDISQLPSLVDATRPLDMVICTDTSVFTGYIFNLGSQNTLILDGQSPSLYTVTYHTTQADADNGTNPLPVDYANTSNGQVIYARVIHNFIPLCHVVVSFRLIVNRIPDIEMDTQYYICESGIVTISAQPGFDLYEWSNGATGQTIVVSQPGDYILTASNLYQGITCSASIEVNVGTSSRATIIDVETYDWTTNQNNITIYAEGIGNYVYSIDGINYQQSNNFAGLETGIYTVYVKDLNGCGITAKEVWLLNYPKFFTPNADGTNDRWRIKYSSLEPAMKVFIFDRFGKLITGFNGTDPGWDGTLNGSRLPATDYWFVVERADGKIHKGHFSLLR